jgi:hypothetical protein
MQVEVVASNNSHLCPLQKVAPLFSQLFLCLSRACLGRKMILSVKWRKKGVFLTTIDRIFCSSSPSGSSRPVKTHPSLF